MNETQPHYWDHPRFFTVERVTRTLGLRLPHYSKEALVRLMHEPQDTLLLAAQALNCTIFPRPPVPYSLTQLMRLFSEKFAQSFEELPDAVTDHALGLTTIQERVRNGWVIIYTNAVPESESKTWAEQCALLPKGAGMVPNVATVAWGSILLLTQHEQPFKKVTVRTRTAIDTDHHVTLTITKKRVVLGIEHDTSRRHTLGIASLLI